MAEISWQKSTFSGGTPPNECVELAGTEGRVQLRESDTPETAVATSVEVLERFLREVKAGRFDSLR